MDTQDQYAHVNTKLLRDADGNKYQWRPQECQARTEACKHHRVVL